jgi:hypothetical protein
VIHGEPVTGATKPALDLVGDEDDAVVRRPLRERRQEAVGRHHESALALNGLDQERRDVVHADLRLDDLDGTRRRLRPAQSVAERVAHRDPVDLGREGTEAILVGHVLGGERHRQIGAAVIGVVKDDDGTLAGRDRATLTAFSTASAPELNSRPSVLA